jgi:hypothetical protein
MSNKNKPSSKSSDILPVMDAILKQLEDGTTTEYKVRNLVKFKPKYKDPVEAALAKFEVNKKRKKKEEAAKKKTAPLRNVRKGGEFSHGGPVPKPKKISPALKSASKSTEKMFDAIIKPMIKGKGSSFKGTF